MSSGQPSTLLHPIIPHALGWRDRQLLTTAVPVSLSMAKQSAGLLMYRRQPDLEVLLVHPGGPFWQKRDLGVWTIPKGLVEEGEDLFHTACREFIEETGLTPQAPFLELPEIRQSNKRVKAWAFEGDCDPAQIRSNTFWLEWPPKSGQMQEFPEVDRANWFTLDQAARYLLKAQGPLLTSLQTQLDTLELPTNS